MMIRGISRLVLAFAAFAGTSFGSVYWVDWMQQTGTGATGQIVVGANTINVTYTGEIQFIQTNGVGTNYWNPSSPYISATVPNAPPDPDIIALSQQSTKTLTFDQPIDGLVFAVVSLNGNGYSFNRDFSILSSGCGYWGCGALGKSTPSAGVYELDGVSGEPHGVIQFAGSTTTITWNSLTAENWNGFTIGVEGLAAAETPEPSTMYLAFGLLPLLGAAWRKRRLSH
jgi:hypothetical protein